MTLGRRLARFSACLWILGGEANGFVMTLTFKNAIPFICLIAALAMAPVAPEASNALFLVASAIGLFLIWPQVTIEFGRPIMWMPLAGLLLIGLAYVISAGPAGLEGLLYFLPLLAIVPLVTLLKGFESSSLAAWTGLLALCGTAGAAVMAIFEVQTTGTNRAGTLVANPIHFADVVLLVSFCALVGVLSSRHWARYLFLSVPIVAVVPIILSGTRGAIVAAVAMFGVMALVAALTRLLPRRIVLLGIVALVILAVLALALGASSLSGVQRVLIDISDTFAHGAPTDYSTDLRLQMYLGGFRAFLDAPIFGHGPFAFTTVANSMADGSFAGTPHLHNDLIDLAASAGTLGIIAYGLIVLAPIVEALRMPKSTLRRWTITLTTTLISGFVAMGLTNAMFGILAVTIAFATICVLTGVIAGWGGSEAEHHAS
ncbi:O-antigen ligase family protein [Devosia sp. XK-2]|uniref:O-antigen ligase family protein n=1 Tax=Devosia sp. XK-2 TaxID=3126689 RepID=UPI0030D4CA5B